MPRRWLTTFFASQLVLGYFSAGLQSEPAPPPSSENQPQPKKEEDSADKKEEPRRPGDFRIPDKLKVGDNAPDFALKSLDGKQTVTLSSFREKKPVVLLFGSYT